MRTLAGEYLMTRKEVCHEVKLFFFIFKNKFREELMANQCVIVKQAYSSDARINSSIEKLVRTFIQLLLSCLVLFDNFLSLWCQWLEWYTLFYGERRVYKRGCIPVRSSHISSEFWPSWTLATNGQISRNHLKYSVDIFKRKWICLK